VTPLPLDKWTQQDTGKLEIAYPPGHVGTWPLEDSFEGDHPRWCGVPLGCILGHVEVPRHFVFLNLTSDPFSTGPPCVRRGSS